MRKLFLACLAGLIVAAAGCGDDDTGSPIDAAATPDVIVLPPDAEPGTPDAEPGTPDAAPVDAPPPIDAAPAIDAPPPVDAAPPIDAPFPEVCDDTVDNDGDGAADCADLDCAAFPACASALVQNGQPCLGDGNCQSGFCLTEPTYGFPGGYCIQACTVGDDTTCTFGGTCVATGGGGYCFTACDEATACARAGYVCFPLYVSGEDCTNGADDDGDGDADCADDADCDGLGACPIPPSREICGNLDASGNPIDDNGDGAVDCADPDCAGAGICDGACAAYCTADAECTVTGVCDEAAGGGSGLCYRESACDDTVDNEGDGLIDCADPDCAGSGTCPLAADGSPCTASAQCTGGFCLDEATYGWPGGMCVSGCDLMTLDCPGDGVCLDAGGGSGICVDGCAVLGDCRAGYSCLDPGGGATACFPDCDAAADCPDTGVCNIYSGLCEPTTGAIDGAPCTASGDCAGGFCLDEATYGWPGGLCVSGCDLMAPACPGDGVCVDAGGSGICIDGCGVAGDCRAAYDCVDFGGGATGCYPDCAVAADCPDTGTCNASSGLCQPVGTALDGEPCVGDGDCVSGFCVDEPTNGFPGGTCMSFCSTATPTCPGDGACMMAAGDTSGPCYDSCTTTADCRAGYGCFEFSAGVFVCYPDCDADAECTVTGACNVWQGFCGPTGTAGIDGAPCTADTDCESGFCFAEDPMTGDWPGGSCASLCTISADNCPADSTDGVASPCLQGTSGTSDLGVCVDGCSMNSHCRTAEGYTCYAAYGICY